MQAILSEQEYQEYLKLKSDVLKGGNSVDEQVAEQLEKLVKTIQNAAMTSSAYLSANDVVDLIRKIARQIRSKSHLTNPPE